MSRMTPWEAGTEVELAHSDVREIDALAFALHMLFKNATNEGLPEPFASHAVVLLDMLRGSSEQARTHTEVLDGAGIRHWKMSPQ